MPSDAVATGSSHDYCAALTRLLSDEIILRIWQYLGAAELARLQCVCRRFNSLAADPQVSHSEYEREPVDLNTEKPFVLR